MRKFHYTKLRIALGLLFLLVFGGILGYRILSGYSWIDAIYMTVITITTVGFGELNPPNAIEKIFTTVLIISSIVIVSYAITVITEYIISNTSIRNLKNKRMQEKIDKLENHVIVCGYGRNGLEAVEKLQSYKKNFVIIDIDEDMIDHETESDYLFIAGNANDDEILLKAGIERATTLICAMPDDADNLFTVLTGRQLNKGLLIISRAAEEPSVRKLKLAGADNVVLPDKIGGDHMASLVVMPDLVEFLNNLSVSGRDTVNVQQIPYENVCPHHETRTIKEIDLRHRTGCSIIGYKTPEGGYIVNPEADTILKEGSKIIVIGRPDQIQKLQSEFGI